MGNLKLKEYSKSVHFKITLVIWVFLILIAIQTFGAETTYYVDTDVVGGGADGSSWADAYDLLGFFVGAQQKRILPLL